MCSRTYRKHTGALRSQRVKDAIPHCFAPKSPPFKSEIASSRWQDGYQTPQPEQVVFWKFMVGDKVMSPSRIDEGQDTWGGRLGETGE